MKSKKYHEARVKLENESKNQEDPFQMPKQKNLIEQEFQLLIKG